MAIRYGRAQRNPIDGSDVFRADIGIIDGRIRDHRRKTRRRPRAINADVTSLRRACRQPLSLEQRSSMGVMEADDSSPPRALPLAEARTTVISFAAQYCGMSLRQW